jgi:hypothetical protein
MCPFVLTTALRKKAERKSQATICKLWLTGYDERAERDLTRASRHERINEP